MKDQTVTVGTIVYQRGPYTETCTHHIDNAWLIRCVENAVTVMYRIEWQYSHGYITNAVAKNLIDALAIFYQHVSSNDQWEYAFSHCRDFEHATEQETYVISCQANFNQVVTSDHKSAVKILSYWYEELEAHNPHALLPYRDDIDEYLRSFISA